MIEVVVEMVCVGVMMMDEVDKRRDSKWWCVKVTAE